MFNRINPDEKNFSIFKEINKIHRHIKKSNQILTEKSTKKSLIDDFSKKTSRINTRLLELSQTTQ